MGFDLELIFKLLTAITKSVQDGVPVLDDPNEIAFYVVSVFSMLAECIPAAGGFMSQFSLLIGECLFPQKSAAENMWLQLRERIEKLIDTKLEVYHLKTLTAKIQGLQNGMRNYGHFCRNLDEAVTEDDRQRAREALRSAHMSFLAVLIDEVPSFQVLGYEVASLPLFALAANLHLVVLVDGIKNGKAWGHGDSAIKTFRQSFEEKTSPRTTSDRSNNDLDYVSYARKIYAEGRDQVKPDLNHDLDVYPESYNPGITAASTFKAYAAYESTMIMNVLNYVTMWPFLAGKPVTADAKRQLCREIFYGPFGRYSFRAGWSVRDSFPIDDYSQRITSVNVRGGDDIDFLQIKYGDQWGEKFGNPDGGLPVQLDLAQDEYVKSVDLWYGQKLGWLQFMTNKGRAVETGRHVHAKFGDIPTAPEGYQLSRVYITKYESHAPPGCEGIILGFRPLLASPSRD